jgi:GTP-binding protein Era
MKYKSGFVTIIGNPNVGKSTLFNNLLDYELSIVTSKSQTTRDSIKGIITTDNYQIVLSDTPGHVEASYMLHSKMNKNIFSSLEGSDLIIYVTDIYEKIVNNRLIEAVNKLEIPIYFLVNKKDQLKEKKYLPSVEHSTFSDYDMVSADDKDDCKMILKKIVSYLPIHSPYYLNDDLTNKSERFIVSEIIRKEVFELYKKEVPYSTHIETESFKNEEKLLSIYCYVYVETESQKMIVLGKNGSKIKIIGTNSRKKIEKMYDKKVFIDLTVKVLKWRNNNNFIKGKY